MIGLGQTYSGELLSVPSGTVSKWRKKLGLRRVSNTEGQQQSWRRSIYTVRPCLTCHANALLMPKESAFLVGWGSKARDTVPRFRKRFGLWLPTKSQRSQADAVKRGRQKGSAQWKATLAIRSQVHRIKRAGKAAGDYCDILGCTFDQAQKHIEAKFKEGMHWLNHGSWHIDHIIPIAWFDLRERHQLLAAAHYTNLQPLWAKENLSKGARRL